MGDWGDSGRGLDVGAALERVKEQRESYSTGLLRASQLCACAVKLLGLECDQTVLGKLSCGGRLFIC